MASLAARPLIILLAFFMTALAQRAAPAQSAFPQLTSRVVDEAGILDAKTRQELTAKLAALEAKTTDQLVVVTLKSLGGRSIEDYGVRLGRTWKIGQKGKNNGVLLIVAPNERKVRIEVGYGLEGTLTDAISKFIIENSIIPRFRAGDFPGGIRRGADDIIQVLSGEGEQFRQLAAARRDSRVTPAPMFVLYLGAMIILVIVAFVMWLVTIGDNRPRGRGRRRQTSGWSWGSSDSSSDSSSWSSSSDSSDSFSGGGGDFGGGGSSGSW
jgi:uncharacterized protein